VVKEGPVISITGNRQVFLQDQAVTIDELPALLQAMVEDKTSVPVYLRSDEEVPYGFVLKVMAAVEREGYLNLSLVADQPDGE
jgi:biopolymer transport protein ExbD